MFISLTEIASTCHLSVSNIKWKVKDLEKEDWYRKNLQEVSKIYFWLQLLAFS